MWTARQNKPGSVQTLLRIGSILVLTLIFTLPVYPQDNAIVAEALNDERSGKSDKKSWVSVRGGVVLPDFYKKPEDAVRPPVLEDPLIGFQAGLSIEMGHSRWYGSRIELSYVKKGAKELFVESNNAIESTTKLDYIQAVVLPVILKPGFRKIQPYVGFGGYAGYLVQADQSLMVNGRVGTSVTNYAGNFNWLDYGWAFSLGCYLGRHPLELRYEAGLANVFKERRIPSSARNQALSIHFSI